ncbi:hypothetical protein PUN28_012658 [Cardiocondyla obscurior]|uniref:Uncharacterized protein n=1 Tax=Cardiocondyla obscurior TaxID=286306 RepID=A0AAW2FGE6_9HYME
MWKRRRRSRLNKRSVQEDLRRKIGKREQSPMNRPYLYVSSGRKHCASHLHGNPGHIGENVMCVTKSRKKKKKKKKNSHMEFNISHNRLLIFRNEANLKQVRSRIINGRVVGAMIAAVINGGRDNATRARASVVQEERSPPSSIMGRRDHLLRPTILELCRPWASAFSTRATRSARPREIKRDFVGRNLTWRRMDATMIDRRFGAIRRGKKKCAVLSDKTAADAALRSNFAPFGKQTSSRPLSPSLSLSRPRRMTVNDMIDRDQVRDHETRRLE